MIRTAILRGAAVEPHLEAVAHLRIAVFREFPYLYDGTLEYERTYLSTYAASPESLTVLAFDGDGDGTVVGASTALPMRDADDAFRAPFAGSRWSPDEIFYFGESVVLPTFRGRGLGRVFFAERERAARDGGFRVATFCAVVRDEDDPRRPAGYRPHDEWWRRLGFERHDKLAARFPWKEVGRAGETTNTLVFWTKDLS